MKPKQGVPLGQGKNYAAHCRHCWMSRSQHVDDKCMWIPQRFEPLLCPVCKAPILFDDDATPLDSTQTYDEDDCGACNLWLPA